MTALQRTLSLTSAISIVIGGVIGSGIFMKPALMAAQLSSPILLLSVWIVAGLITLSGALSNAEVASMFPETGGQFVFFQKMYGERFAFLYGWAAFAVFNTGGNASIAYVCSQYTNYFIELPRFAPATETGVFFHLPFIGDIFPLQNMGVKLLTIFIILLLSFINSYSVQYGAGLQRVLTSLKAIAIFLIIGGILFSGKGTWNNLAPLSHVPQGVALLGAYMTAIAGAFWAYDGWNNITFIAGEIKQPQKNIPLSLFTGIAFCIVVYALVNLAFIYVLPIGAIAGSSFVASDAAGMVWGAAGAGLIAFMIIFSTFGTANANVLATARVTYAMGEENRLFTRAAKTQPHHNTPSNALWFNAAWSVVLIISGSFDTLTDMLIFVSWFFYGMSALGLFILRYKMKDIERPYKVFGYPLVPLIFILFTTLFLIVTMYTDISNYQAGKTHIINSLLGILITCIGIPVYYWGRKR